MYVQHVDNVHRSVISKERSAALRALTELIDAGSVMPSIDAVHPLADGALAFDRLSTGQVRGELVLTP